MDNKSTTKRMIGAVVLVLIAALLLAWLLKGKNQSVQEQQELIADQTQEASPILGFPGVNEGKEGEGDDQVAQNTDGQANQNGDAAQDGSGSYVIGAADQADKAANEAQQQAKNALAASGAAISGAASQAVDAVKEAGQDVANATGFQVRDSQGQEGAEQRPIVEGGEIKKGTGSMGSSEVATNGQDQQQTGDAANNTQQAATAAGSGNAGSVTQQAPAATDNSGSGSSSAQQNTQQASGGSNNGASQSGGNAVAVVNPKLVNEKAVPAPRTQRASSSAGSSNSSDRTSRATSSGNRQSASANNKSSSSSSSSSSGGQAVGGRGYAIQVLAASSRRKAENVRKDIARDGYPAFVVRANVNGKTVYRVRVGTYPAKGAARAVQTRMKARYTKNQFVQNSFVTRN